MRNGRSLPMAVWALVIGTAASAQLVAPQLRTIGVKDGLTYGSVQDMVLDHRGYLWVATANGLDRFDGRHVKAYRNTGDRRSLPGDLVTSLAMDTGRFLYVGTNAPYLTIIDVLRDTMVSIPLPIPAFSRHGEQRVTDILIDHSQRIWVAHGARCLSLFHPRTNAFSTTEVPPPMPTPASRERIASITEDAEGILWLAMFKGLVRFDPRTGVPVAEDLHPAPGRTILAKYFQIGGLVDEDSSLVFGTWSEGIFRMRKSDGLLHQLWPDPRHLPTYVDHMVTDMVRVPGDKAMVACFDLGLLQLDLRTGQVTHFDRRFTEPDCRKKEDTFPGCYRVRRFGELLVMGSVRGGIALCSLREHPVQGVPLPMHPSNEIIDEVLAITRDPATDNILALAFRHGLFIHDSAGALLRLIGMPYDPDRGYSDLQHLSGDRWFIGGGPGSLMTSIREDKTFQALQGPLAACGPGIRWVRPAVGHALWCWRPGEGFIHLDTLNGHPVPLAKGWPAVAASISPAPFDVFLDSRDRTWFLSANKPPVVLLPDGRVQIVHGPAGLAPFEVSDMAETPDGRIWLAVKHAGLALVAATGPIAPVDVSDRLPERNVVQVAAVNDNTLWFAGPGGLMHWDPRSGLGRLFNLMDGIEPGPLDLDPSHRPLRYPVLVGTWEGFYMVRDIDRKGPPPPSVQLPAVFCMDTLVRRQADMDAAPLVLPYTAKRITVELRTTNLLDPARDSIDYRLTGQSDRWASIGANERITFNNLPAGHYRFEARARAYGGDLGPATTMQLILLPPVWATWWFRAAAAVLLLAVAWYVVRITVRAKLRAERRRMEHEQALMEERMRIAHDLHDDLGSGLASIRMESELAGMATTDPGTQDVLRRVSENARNVGDDMRRIIWAMGSGQESLGDLLAYTRGLAAEMLDQAGVELCFEAKVERPRRMMTMEQRRHLVLFTKEVLHNTVKHASARRVMMTVTDEADTLRWRIADDGKGYEALPGGRNGTGTASMGNRAMVLRAALAVDSAPGKGTSVELTMPW